MRLLETPEGLRLLPPSLDTEAGPPPAQNEPQSASGLSEEQLENILATVLAEKGYAQPSPFDDHTDEPPAEPQETVLEDGSGFFVAEVETETPPAEEPVEPDSYRAGYDDGYSYGLRFGVGFGVVLALGIGAGVWYALKRRQS